MLSITRVSLALFAVLSSSILLAESKLDHDVEAINKKLVFAVRDRDNLDENFAALEKIIEETRKKTILFNKASLIELLVGLASLKDVKCTYDYFETLYEVNNAFDNEARRSDPPHHRISKIVYDLNKIHAAKCADFYKNSLKTKVLDQEQADKVNVFYEYLIEYPTRRLFTKLDMVHSWELYGTSFLRALRQNTKNPEDSDHISRHIDEIRGVVTADERNFRDVFRRNLLEPCKYYVHEMRDICRPIFLHADMLPNHEGISEEFYPSLGKYKLCNQLIDEQVEAFRTLVRYAKDKKN